MPSRLARVGWFEVLLQFWWKLRVDNLNHSRQIWVHWSVAQGPKGSVACSSKWWLWSSGWIIESTGKPFYPLPHCSWTRRVHPYVGKPLQTVPLSNLPQDYSNATNEALPHAVQIADRWHLLQNLCDGLKKLVELESPEFKVCTTERNTKPEKSIHKAGNFLTW